MNVILDSNVYLALLLQTGRQFTTSTQFAELLAYIRRTGSHLVVPLLVFWEVVERYRSNLTERIEKANSACSRIRKMAMTDVNPFTEPDILREVNELRKLLRRPAEGMRTEIYSDVSGVDVQEVVRRGIKRIRPASDKGEELRDVILWLMAIQYAKQHGNVVAFVSNDGTFADGDGTSLHPDLRSEIDDAGVDICFYRSVKDFITDNALETDPLTEDWLTQYVASQEIEQMARGTLERLSVEGLSRTRASIREAQIGQLTFDGGQRYTVGEDSYYVEGVYVGRGLLKVREKLWKRALPRQLTHGLDALLRPAGVLPKLQQAHLAPAFFGPSESTNVFISSPPSAIFEQAEPPWVGIGWPGIGGLETVEVDVTYRCEFSLGFSARIVGGERVAMQLETFLASNLTLEEREEH